MLKYQAFKEGLFVRHSIIIVLHCIALYVLKPQSFDHKTSIKYH